MNKTTSRIEHLWDVHSVIFGAVCFLLISLGPLTCTLYFAQASHHLLSWNTGLLLEFAKTYRGWLFAVLCGATVLSLSSAGCWLTLRTNNFIYLLVLGPIFSEVIGFLEESMDAFDLPV